MDQPFARLGQDRLGQDGGGAYRAAAGVPQGEAEVFLCVRAGHMRGQAGGQVCRAGDQRRCEWSFRLAWTALRTPRRISSRGAGVAGWRVVLRLVYCR